MGGGVDDVFLFIGQLFKTHKSVFQRVLAKSQPDLSARLHARLTAWQRETNAPTPREPNPAYDPAARSQGGGKGDGKGGGEGKGDGKGGGKGGGKGKGQKPGPADGTGEPPGATP